MERLTTDNPHGNMESARNLFYIKDGETWVLGGGPESDYKDATLYNFVRRITELHGLDIITSDNEAMGEHLYDLFLDGVDTIEGVVALLYTAAWAFSELRERLKAYEDKIPFDRLDEAAALVKAQDEELLLEMPCKPGTELFGHCDIRGADPISRGYFRPPHIPKLGVDAWLTRAEAEAALQEGGSHEADPV